MSMEERERDALTDEEIAEAQGGAGDPGPREISKDCFSQNDPVMYDRDQ